MKKDDIEKYCRFCENAKTLSDGDTMLCDIYGVVASTHKCRKFMYDPMKRMPKRLGKTPELEFVDIDGEKTNNE